MDTPGYPQSDPSLSLLNEIEILLAQTRLMELYLKQAQVSAAHKASRSTNAPGRTRRAAPRARRKRTGCRHPAKRVSANEKTLAEQIENLQVRVSDQQNLLASKEGQQRQADAEISGLRQRIVDLETAKKQSEAAAQRSSQTCHDLEAALAALRLELEENGATSNASSGGSRTSTRARGNNSSACRINWSKDKSGSRRRR